MTNRPTRPHHWRTVLLRVGLIFVLCATLALTVAPSATEAQGKQSGHGEHGISFGPTSTTPPQQATTKAKRQPKLTSKPKAQKAPGAHQNFGANSITSTFAANDITAPVANHTLDPRDLKVLVISATATDPDPSNPGILLDPDYQGISAFLNQVGVPFDTLKASTTDLTASMLWDGVSHGYYQGIILTEGYLLYNAGGGNFVTAFTDPEWQTLWTYEAMFGVRQVTTYTLPQSYIDPATSQVVYVPESYGLVNPTFAYQDTSATPLQAKLTTVGQGIFSYLNTASQITVKNAWTYLNTINPAEAASVTPLVSTADGQYTLGAIKTFADGRQNLAISAENNSFITHSQLLSYGIINWVTKGMFLGERHVVMDVQPDDLYIDDDMWDSTAMTDTTGITYRMSGTDLTKFAAWQNGVHTKYNMLAKDFRVEWPFNAEGTTGIYPNDTLTAAVLANKDQFNFISHTYTHQNLDTVDATTTQTELQKNQRYANLNNFSSSLTTGSKYFKNSMIQPDISGLFNQTFQQAAYSWGIRYMISDRSHPEWNGSGPNMGINSTLQPGLLIIPRFASNLFYNLRTPAQWVSEYNCYYGPNGPCPTFPNSTRADHNLTYQEIINYESDVWLSYMLKWDISPIMFHQPNTATYDGTHSLLGDLIDATLTKYSAAYNLPIQNLTLHEIGLKMTDWMGYRTSGVTATYNPKAKTITLKTVKAAIIPFTGITRGNKTEIYGGQIISHITMSANQTLTFKVS